MTTRAAAFAALLGLLIAAGTARAQAPAATPPPAPAAAPAAPRPAPPPAAPAKPTLLVFNLVAEQGIEKSVTNLLTELIIDKVSKLNRYTVMGQKDLEKMVFWEQNKQLQGCTDSSCLVQIAGAMGASFYIEGSAGSVGSQYIITLKLIDAHKVEVVSRSTTRVKKDDDVMVETVVRMVGELTPAEPPPPAKAPAKPDDKPAAAPRAPFQERKDEPAKAEGAPAGRSRFWRWMTLGTGAGLVVVGGAFTGSARQANTDYEAHKISRSNAEDTIQRNNAIAVPCYLAGLGLIGTGIYLWVKESREEAAPTAPKAALDLAPTGGGAIVTWGGRW
jgi:TolB-like protein